MESLDWYAFRNKVIDSGLATAEDLIHWLGPGDVNDVRQAARVLVKANLLTEWQAKFLLTGRSRLRIGGYVLTDRLRRDELGDHFLARQEKLDRRVDLLILANEWGTDTRDRQRFLDCAAKLTKLDHPRLEHVLDVGQEADRLYVVSEFVEADEINKDTMRRDGMTLMARLQIVHDWTTAVAHAMQQGIPMSGLSLSNLAIDTSQRGKVIHIVALALRSDIPHADGNRSIAGFSENWKTLGQAAGMLLDEGVPSEMQHLRQLANGLADGTFMDPTGFQHALIESLSNERARQPLVKSKTSRKMEAVGAPSATDATQSTSSNGRLVGGIVAGLALLTAGILFVKSGWSGTDARTPVAEFDDVPSDIYQMGQPTDVSPPRRPSSVSSRRSSAAKKDPFELAKEDDGTAVANTVLETNKSHETNVDADPAESGDASGTNVSALPKHPLFQSTPSEPTAGSASVPGAHNEPQQDGPKPKKDPFVVPGTAAPAAPQTSGAAVGTNPRPAGATSDPFSGVPLRTALAAADNKQPQTIGLLATEQINDLRIAFVSDPETIGRGKLYFSVALDSTANHLWRIQMQRQATDQPFEPIADVHWRDGQIEFVWRAEVDARSPANYLVNGWLRLQLGEHERLVSLREPVVITPLALNGETLGARAQFDVDWLPQNYRVELGALTVENGWERAVPEASEWTTKQPLVFRFRSAPEEQVFWLVGQFDARNRLTFNLDTMSAFGPRPLKRRDLELAVETLNQRYRFLVDAEAQAKLEADNAPYGQKTKARERANEARAAANEGRRARDIAAEVQEAVLQLIDRELPLRIVYSFGDHHIELARSANFVESKKP